MGVYLYRLGTRAFRQRDPVSLSASAAGDVRNGITSFHPLQGCKMTSSTDQFSASITQVPEQMRTFSEKGISQVRDNYAKFKDAAETHNGTIEAVFTTASKGASAYSAKLLEFFKANTTSSLDFAQELVGVKTPAAAMELGPSH